MSLPTLLPATPAGADTHLLTTYAPLPGLGVVPVNAFLLRARQPVLIDTGIGALQDAFLHELGRLIDPVDLRWIWVTHADADHVGSLRRLLELAPNARVITNYLGMGKLGLLGLPLDRVRLLNPGQQLDVGDRQLLALQPPVYDAPETMGLFDSRTRHLFSSDCFGALLDREYDSAEAIAPITLRKRMQLWATIDSPWLHAVGRDRLAPALRVVSALAPARVLSSHLPPAMGATTARLIDELMGACDAPPFVGPDQAALEASVQQALAPA